MGERRWYKGDWYDKLWYEGKTVIKKRNVVINDVLYGQRA